ncbi:MAG: beta-ketoacyl synthase chain length factor [Planctomycetes bacterium]|nr:beta-ketoacyl synthase chain length factor [Planctomycetota bacterium]
MRLTRYAAVAGEPLPAWPDWVQGGQRRRLDALNRLALAAVDRVLAQGSAFDPETAVVVANSYGSVDSTLRFITSISNFGDQGASPTPFTTSVHNSTAGIIGELLKLHGPCTTLSQGGTGGLSALRWAHLMLAARRAPAVLVVVGDKHVAWSRDIVGRLSDSPWPIGDGAAACLIAPDTANGREIRLGRHESARCLDGGALLEPDERTLADLARGQARQRAPDLLGSWWPSCLLAALPLDDPSPLQLREIEHQHVLEAWVGPAAT